ncbi:Threonyl/alanyl tRNA synthetase [Lophiotrema nucula]|uniref:Threonyl/alanyl tRNA synthetase n=1 Tax=Lophiotrema nucula TaxID=690887 RepID=A0A6A5YQ06_9PLEO|nr:Threonyl/alanyl tRNA synthetase [Lophiotrema nucula]
MAAAGPVFPSVVGALRCQKDSYLRVFETEVVSCTEFIPPKSAQANGKHKAQKKANDPSKIFENGGSPDAKYWLLELADSVLFPEGGGQPTDHGSLTPVLADVGESIQIRSVQRHGLRCIHFSPKPLEPGTTVRQDVDFHRRWDHMQQHTGQHLLSAVMDRVENLETLGWGMGAEGEMNYVELPRKLSDEEIQEIQTRCNEVIRDNIPITVETPQDTKAESLPEDYDKEKGVVRFIKIGDLDYNACCGTHLKQTSHVSVILLHHTQTIRGTNCRLFFTCGDRAINMATASIDKMRLIAQSLSSGQKPAEVQASVGLLGDRLAESRKKTSNLLKEIAKYESDRIKAALGPGKTVFSHRATDGLDFINLVTFELKEAIKGGGAVVLASGETKEPGSVMIIGETELVEPLAVKAKETISTVKGGGKGEKWQGKVTEWQKGEVDALRKLVVS